jgi:hypothetical protein
VTNNSKQTRYIVLRALQVLTPSVCAVGVPLRPGVSHDLGNCHDGHPLC